MVNVRDSFVAIASAILKAVFADRERFYMELLCRPECWIDGDHLGFRYPILSGGATPGWRATHIPGKGISTAVSHLSAKM